MKGKIAKMQEVKLSDDEVFQDERGELTPTYTALNVLFAEHIKGMGIDELLRTQELVGKTYRKRLSEFNVI